MKPFIATRDSKCPICGEWIRTGDNYCWLDEIVVCCNCFKNGGIEWKELGHEQNTEES